MPPALYVYRQSTPHGRAHRHRLRRHARGVPRRPGAGPRVGAARHASTGSRATSPRMPQHVELVSTLHEAGPVVRATLALAPELPPDRDVVGPTARATRCGGSRAARRPTSCAGSWAPSPTTSPTGTTGWPPASRCGRAPVGTRAAACSAWPTRSTGCGSAAIDRRVAGPVDAALVRDLLEASFDVRPVADAREALSAGIAVASTAAGTPRRYAGERPPGSPGLDVSLLHDHVLDRLPAGTVVEPTRDSIEVLARGVRRGRRRAVRAARTGARRPSSRSPTRARSVPAKSTYFSPKPGSGIFLRDPAGGRRGRGRTATLPLPS